MEELIDKTIELETPIPDFEQNEKGQIIKGVAQDTNKNGTAGRPCKLCENLVSMTKTLSDYLEECQSISKPKIPFIEEIALRLKAHRETIMEWAKNKEDHPDFSDLIYTAQTLQSLRLQQRVLGRYNPTGAISLLKWHHGMIETEKRILAGDKDAPVKLEIEIIEDKPNTDE